MSCVGRWWPRSACASSRAHRRRRNGSSPRTTCGTLPQPQWVAAVDLHTGSVLQRAFNLPYGFAQRIATAPAGSRLWVSTAQSGFAAPASVVVFDTSTGRLLAVNLAVHPEQRPYKTYLQYVQPNVILLVTDEGLTALRGDTLQPIRAADAPRFRLPQEQIPPSYAPQFSYQVMIDPLMRGIVTYEWSAVNYSYHGARACRPLWCC